MLISVTPESWRDAACHARPGSGITLGTGALAVAHGWPYGNSPCQFFVS
jgi:hypothetical protein